MHLNQLKEELERVLPENHPFVQKFKDWEPSPDHDFERLVSQLEDWERGIRDWSEVRDLISSLRSVS